MYFEKSFVVSYCLLKCIFERSRSDLYCYKFKPSIGWVQLEGQKPSIGWVQLEGQKPAIGWVQLEGQKPAIGWVQLEGQKPGTLATTPVYVNTNNSLAVLKSSGKDGF